MDSCQIDELTRNFANDPASRRSVIKSLAGGALAAGLTRLGLRGAAAACNSIGQPCSKNSQCCSKRCYKGKCRCQKVGGSCDAGAGQCCGAASGATVCSTSKCASGLRCCRANGQTCSANCDCCSSQQCQGGHCCVPKGKLCIIGGITIFKCCQGLACNPSTKTCE